MSNGKPAMQPAPLLVLIGTQYPSFFHPFLSPLSLGWGEDGVGNVNYTKRMNGNKDV